jgi:hypothetical protein
VLGGESLGTLDVEDRLQRLPLQRSEPARELGVPPPRQPPGEVNLRGGRHRGMRGGRDGTAAAVISGRAADGGGRRRGGAQESQREPPHRRSTVDVPRSGFWAEPFAANQLRALGL